VRLREAGGAFESPDYSIVNPKHLDAPLREAVCQQCHLAGEARVPRAGRSPSDYRPGLPLDAVVRVLVFDHHGEDRKAVNHVEQMYLSKCYLGSGGKLGCTTCHDPHEKASVETRTERYRAACLKCHNCTSPVATRAALGAPDNCTACHMPRFTAKDIAHAATTDHRIVRTREAPKPGNAPRPGLQAPLFFPGRQPDFRSPVDGRDFAVGLIEMAKHGKIPPREAARDALPLLESAIAESPNDARAWEAKAHALEVAGRKSEALAATQTVLSLVPEHEIALTRAAALAFESNQPQQALKFWQKAVAVNPTSAGYRQELATVFARTGDWKAAGTEAREALRLDPARSTARAILAISESRAGNTTRADELFRTIEQLDPPNLGQLREWYRAERTRP
jgi:Tfp pilus assembly protein PilF